MLHIKASLIGALGLLWTCKKNNNSFQYLVSQPFLFDKDIKSKQNSYETPLIQSFT